MKAVLSKKSGSANLLKLVDIPKPIPKENEILVKVYATSVTRGDVILRKIPRFILAPMGLLFGFKAMDIPGVEFSGIIEDVGTNVESYNVGDRVFGTSTGLQFGGNAEYLCVPKSSRHSVLSILPDSIGFNDGAVLLVGGMSALQLLPKEKIKEGTKVLINGASGSVGTYAVQISKYLGGIVTAVCSKENSSLVESIGAVSMIDYKASDFRESDTKYDIIFDAVGNISRTTCKKVLNNNGTFVSIKSLTKETLQDLNYLLELYENGAIRPVIDRIYNIEEIVEAHIYVESKRKKGNIVINV